MKANKMIVIGMVLMLIPAMSLGALAQEQEGVKPVEIGQWKSARLIGVVFESANTTYTTENDTFYFTIPDTRSGIRKGPSDMLYQKIVFDVKFENNTTNATQLQPDEKGIYKIDTKEPGNYTILVVSAPAFPPIPIIGDRITPTQSTQITVVREHGGWQLDGPVIPTNQFWPVMLGVIIASAVLYLVLRVIRGREESEEEEELEEEDIEGDDEEYQEDQEKE